MFENLKIGIISLKNALVSAPMAGISDIAFRYLAWKMGAGLTVTEMATSRGLVQGQKRTKKIISTPPDVRPYSVQLFGNDPGILADASKIAVEHGADMIDLNAGCPVPKIIKNGSGAALLKSPKLLAQILRAMRKSVEVPITLMIRSGWSADSIIAPDVAKMAETEGIDAIQFIQDMQNRGLVVKLTGI